MKRAVQSCLSAITALVLLVGVCLCPARSEDAAGAVERVLAGMSLRDKLAQMMIFSPRAWPEEGGRAEEPVTALGEAQWEYIAERRFGGLLLFSENCADAEQTLRLTAALRAATLAGGGVMPLIATDQEGGTIVRLGFATSGVGNMALAATGDPACAREMARVYGEELSLVGIDVDLAPVMDVNDNPSNPVIGVRSFGDDPQAVAAYGAAYLEGLRDAGVISCAKHFPGHGNTDTDSHIGLPLVDRTWEELLQKELVPFRGAVEAGVDMVMTAHIQFPRVETRTYVSIATGEELRLPATMSETLLTDVLRGELGFDGVIVTDALDMKAIADHFAPDDVLALCVNAGVDMLILPCMAGADVWSAADEMLDRAVALAGSGVIGMERVDASVRRILTLKEKTGLLDQTDAAVTEGMISAAVEGCGSGEHRQMAWNIAEKALTLLNNGNGAFPLDVRPGEKTLILFSAASRVGAGDLARRLLEETGALPEGASIECMTIGPRTAEDCVRAAKASDHVLIVSRAWAVDCLDPRTENGFPVGVINRIIGEMHAAGRTAIVISAQLPYDAACYPEADALLLTYGSSAMKGLPDPSGAGSAWAPNLPAAICACFGAAGAEGSLPVDIPALDEAYRPAGGILWSHGQSSDLSASD